MTSFDERNRLIKELHAKLMKRLSKSEELTEEQKIAEAVARRLIGPEEEEEYLRFNTMGNRGVQFVMPNSGPPQPMLYLGNISLPQSEYTEQWQKVTPTPSEPILTVDDVRTKLFGLPPLRKPDV